eukprot:UN24389
MRDRNIDDRTSVAIYKVRTNDECRQKCNLHDNCEVWVANPRGFQINIDANLNPNAGAVDNCHLSDSGFMELSVDEGKVM